MCDPDGQLGRARLSPVPVAARPCSLPYGLTWDDLRDALPGFAEPTGAWVSHTKQGLHKGARSCILTLAYRGVGGTPRTRTLFFKRVDDLARAEAEKYRYLSARDVPTPRLCAAIARDGCEVLVCEFLPTIGIEAGQVDLLLALVARLNAVPDPPVELFRPVPGVPDAEFDARVQAALDRLGAEPEVGVEATVAVEPRRWFRMYRRAQEAVAAMPLALNHNELAFQQVGWSTEDGGRRLVLFDLETMFLVPRLTDLADILDALGSLTGRDECDLVASYVRAWTDHTGDRLDEGEAHAELRLLRIMRSFESLPWLTEMAGHPDVADTPTARARVIHADATAAGLLS